MNVSLTGPFSNLKPLRFTYKLNFPVLYFNEDDIRDSTVLQDETNKDACV